MAIRTDANYDDIGLCALADCNTEAVLRQSIASVLIREVAPNYNNGRLADVVRQRVNFQDDNNYINWIIQVANTIRREHSVEEWESLKVALSRNFTKPKTLSCVHLSELIDAVEESWSVDHESCVDELIFGLLQLALQSKPLDRPYRYSFVQLINMVCPCNARKARVLPLFRNSPRVNPVSQEICDTLHNVRTTRNDIAHHSLRFADDGQKKKFKINYTRAVTFCVESFRCYPLRKRVKCFNMLGIYSWCKVNFL